MTSFRHIFRSMFDERVQKRGVELFNLGKVTRLNSNSEGPEYTVKERETQKVRLDLKNPNQSICSCKEYEDGMWCRHIWACVVEQDETLLRAENSAKSTEPTKNRISSSLGTRANLKTVESVARHAQEKTRFERSEKPAKEESANNAEFSPRASIAQNSNLSTEFEVSLGQNESLISTMNSDINAAADANTDFQSPNSNRDRVLGGSSPEWLEKFRAALRKEAPATYSKLEQRTLFVLNLTKTKEAGKLALEPWIQEKLPTGHWGAIRSNPSMQNESLIQPIVARSILKELSEKKILYYQSTQKNRFLEPVEFREELIQLKVAVSKIDGQFFARGVLALPQSQHELTEIDETFSQFLVMRNCIYEIAFKEEMKLYELFRKERAIEISSEEFDSFLNFFLLESKKLDLKLPPDLEFEELQVAPKVSLQVVQQDTKNNYVINFDMIYSEKSFDHEEASTWIYDLENRKKFVRDVEQEKFLWAEIRRAGLLGSNKLKNLNQTVLNHDALMDCLEVAVENQWPTTVNQKVLKKGLNYSAKLKSQVNWFEIEGTFNFGSEKIDLPLLLKSLRKDQRIVILGSGEMAYIPKLWAQKFKMMARLGQESENGLRISKVQALFLSSFFNEDKSFFIEDNSNSLNTVIEMVKELPEASPGGNFDGDLRPYQKKGLAWIELLKNENIGGILADDMGLGKTVMVLSAIAKLTTQKKLNKRSLIVSPKTLVFNWISEAKKFTPNLEFIEYTGAKRKEALQLASPTAIIVTTYHTLRQDIDDFKDSIFDILIMDEAHYVKNSDSQSYMACRMLQADHKFALTGTPIENSIQDLFSLLSIVNPGMISDSSAQRIEKDPEAIRVLARALQPFVLRRTKEQVLQELPAKVEQIVYCDLSTEERKKYDELKQFYWQQISSGQGEDTTAINTNRVQVLEALLRLRQAACHQGLLEDNLKGSISSKFECVLESLETILAEGKKALIFSQFTSLLKLFATQLEAKGIKYNYLDGKTKDRASIVQDFQANEESKVFLISLKAGGVGLNLTAAEYVFILDPWWNPAAENQAIDRAHRIGQEKTVFAYKIIARDTIEEKILELQRSKLELAKNVVGTDSSLLKGLNLDDLKYLFT